MRRIELPRLGWRRDLPDPRDYSPMHEGVRDLLGALKRRRGKSEPPSQVDLCECVPAVPEDADPADSGAESCTALVASFELRSTGRRLELASPFLAHVARRLSDFDGEAAADLRSTLKALVRFGVPPRAVWPAEDFANSATVDPFFYGFAREFAGIRYVRLDAAEATGSRVLGLVRAFLAAGFPIVFGCSLPNSLSAAGDLSFPTRYDAMRGGAALVAVGYDDDRRIRSSKGALRVRGVWGSGWGEAGFGWLPYRYLEERLAADFWTLLKPEWLASGEFARPVC